ncbi:MAG: phosphoglycerate dehydrogenase [Planctomycetota bacterium]
MKPRVLVTPRSLTNGPHPALSRFADAGYDPVLGPAGRQPDRSEIETLLPGCVGYLAGVEPIDGDTLSRADQLQIIVRNGVGMDNVDLVAARKTGIAVYNLPGINARAVAELTLGLMFALERHICASSAALREARWERTLGRELSGQTLGLLGFGRIGRHVASFAAALGMRVQAFDPFIDSSSLAPQQIRFTSFDTVLRTSDIISLHCPASDDGRPIIGIESLRAMPKGSCFINTARWSLMEPEAVLKSLDSGHLHGCAIDAFASEPPDPHEPLLKHPNVLCTPHIGGYTEQCVVRAAESAVTRMLEALANLDQTNVTVPAGDHA